MDIRKVAIGMKSHPAAVQQGAGDPQPDTAHHLPASMDHVLALGVDEHTALRRRQ